jgi:hypothetical protein
MMRCTKNCLHNFAKQMHEACAGKGKFAWSLCEVCVSFAWSLREVCVKYVWLLAWVPMRVQHK